MGYSLEQLRLLGIVPVDETQPTVPKQKKVQGSPEDDFQRAVLKMAKLFRWTVAHFRRAMTKDGRWITPVAADGKGFPDLLLIHEERKLIIVVELKYKSKPSHEQKRWLALFDLVGIPTYLWRPKHWDEIQSILTGEPHGTVPILSGRYYVGADGKRKKDTSRAVRQRKPRAGRVSESTPIVGC